MGSLSIWHWLIFLAIAILVFGTKRLRGAGSDLGAAVKNFKQAMHEGEADAAKKSVGELGTDNHTQAGSPTASASQRDKV
jgi:sec-independent protein translocase protein TatA